MAYLIGTDEAGYGPNLGPLVISATVWKVPTEVSDRDLYELLDGVVCAELQGSEPLERLSIGDSKVLYRPGGGLGNLERGVWGAMPVPQLPVSWREVWELLAPGCGREMARIPWYCEYDSPAPANNSVEELSRLNGWFHEQLQQRGIRCCQLRARPVFAEQVNALIEQHGGKGAALSHATLELVRDILEPLEPDQVFICCDKHGGRNKYGPLLQHYFPDYLVEVRREGRSESCYAWGPKERRIEVRFLAGGECFLPSALASMTAKYLRELALQAFNHFWCSRLPELRPTAGYPGDSRRFKRDIELLQQELKIDDRILWRCR